MAQVGIFYGSTTGTTRDIAEKIAEKISGAELYDVASAAKEDLEKYDFLIFGSSTWGIGDLQDDWVMFIDVLGEADLNGKKISVFGIGDQIGFGDSFLDAMGTIHDKALEAGATAVGYWSVEGYDFSGSTAIRDDKFVGVGIDEANQADMTDQRIDDWVEILKTEM